MEIIKLAIIFLELACVVSVMKPSCGESDTTALLVAILTIA